MVQIGVNTTFCPIHKGLFHGKEIPRENMLSIGLSLHYL